MGTNGRVESTFCVQFSTYIIEFTLRYDVRAMSDNSLQLSYHDVDVGFVVANPPESVQVSGKVTMPEKQFILNASERCVQTIPVKVPKIFRLVLSKFVKIIKILDFTLNFQSNIDFNR